MPLKAPTITPPIVITTLKTEGNTSIEESNIRLVTIGQL